LFQNGDNSFYLTISFRVKYYKKPPSFTKPGTDGLSESACKLSFTVGGNCVKKPIKPLYISWKHTSYVSSGGGRMAADEI
jgi:hypothetical protein